MAGNTFGQLFKLTTFGESHGVALGGIIDGCPAGFTVNFDAIDKELQRRKPGQSTIVSQRKEDDKVEFLSGIVDGKTTGTPIGFVIYNKDQKPDDYRHNADVYRPSHADYTYDKKYGMRDYRGGGRSSARETVCRVVAGAIAKQILGKFGITIHSYVSQVAEIKLNKTYSEIDLTKIDSTIIRCPDSTIAGAMINLIETTRKAGDTVGGVISCVCQGVPAGLGEPVFDKLHADLGKAMLSINAVKGFEYGAGFHSVTKKGSELNDVFQSKDSKITTATNHSGGIQGGISNGMDIYFNVAFKPVATIMHEQATVTNEGVETSIHGKGRHDPCVLPRAVPIVDSMAALVLLDHLLRNKTSQFNELF